jgi:hypothetical protein
MADYFERFAQWQNYAHYLLLTIIVMIAMMICLGMTHFASFSQGFWLFFQLYMTIFIGDSLVHGLFWILPEPFQWRD